MTREQATQQIEKEFVTATQASGLGNDGMVRVCARRATGIAITYWLKKNPRIGWGVDAMGQLRNLQLDTTLPRNVRDAATRLTTKVTHQFTLLFPVDPIEDSKMIIQCLLSDSNESSSS